MSHAWVCDVVEKVDVEKVDVVEKVDGVCLSIFSV